MRWPAVLSLRRPFLRDIALLCLAGASLVACSTATQSASEAPASAVVAGNETVSLKVLSFNLLYGAGHDRRFDEHVPARFKGRDRMPELLAYLREAGPDVLAVQEGAGWEAGAPSVADEVARELGMSHVVALDEWELHVIVFSKYPIVSAEAVSRFQGFNGVLLRTTLQVTPQTQVNFVAVHFNSMSQQTRSCQVQALLDLTGRLPGRTIVAGDMNFRPASAQAQMLLSNGWQLVAAQERWPIDEIWADPGAQVTTSDWWSRLALPGGISDHWPIGAELTFAAPKSVPVASRPEGRVVPGVLDYECPVQPR